MGLIGNHAAKEIILGPTIGNVKTYEMGRKSEDRGGQQAKNQQRETKDGIRYDFNAQRT